MAHLSTCPLTSHETSSSADRKKTKEDGFKSSHNARFVETLCFLTNYFFSNVFLPKFYWLVRVYFVMNTRYSSGVHHGSDIQAISYVKYKKSD